jgi:hypothetical protein
MTGPNTGLGHNSIIYVIESQTRFILQALRALERRGVAAFDVRLDVQERFNHDLQDRLVKTVWNSGGCRSWYLTADGRNDVLWPDFTFRLRKRLSQFHWDDYFAIPWSIQRT